MISEQIKDVFEFLNCTILLSTKMLFSYDQWCLRVFTSVNSKVSVNSSNTICIKYYKA